MRPNTTLRIIEKFLPFVIGSSLFFLGIGLIFGLYLSPKDFRQGETVRIMYLHVPCSWGALGVYAWMTLFAGISIVKRSPFMVLIVHAMAPIGAVLCLVSLLTGSIWGKPTWGTWWAWDARLTSMLILGLFYGVYFLLSSHILLTFNRAANFVVVLGAINLPIIKWSVTWWHTLHQPASIVPFGNSTIHQTFLTPLFLMTVALAGGSISLFLMRLRSLLIEKRLIAFYLRG